MKLAHNVTSQIVFDFLSRLVKDANHRIILVELTLFSIILGAIPHLWPVACLMFLGLSWVLSKPKGVLNMVYLLSFGWGFIAMSFTYFVNGWGWGIACGIVTLICGLGVHFRDLKQPLNEVNSVQNDTIEYEQNWLFRRQNLN